MWGLIFTVGAVIVLALFPAVRCAVLHPLHVLWYGALDTFGYIRRKQYNLCHTGDLDIYCGYFGSGKTLSLVHKVTGLYEHYDGKPVWCPRRKKFVTQRVLILSNVALSVPYEPLRSLAQVVAASKVNQDYDDEHDTLTITIACVDELGVQLNSRSFRDNIDPTFLSTLLCCRHYYISLYGSAQRFGHVDKLMRDVTLNVIQCRKFWRLQCNSWYDAWELENVTNPELVRPLRRGCWFVRNKDYNAYNTLAVVNTLQKRYDEKDMMTEAEILAARAPAAPTPDAVTNRSRKGRKIQRKEVALRREGFSLRRSTTAAVIHFRVCCRVPARRSELLPVLQRGNLYDLKRISKVARPSHAGFPVGRAFPHAVGRRNRSVRLYALR